MKRIAVVILTFALCLSLSGCSGTSSEQDGSSPEDAMEGSSEQEQAEDGDDEEEAIDEADEEPDYSEGTHHAVIELEGCEDEIELEIYADQAPVTSEAFCTLVDEGYYDGKALNWVLDDMYVKMGSANQDDDALVTGEFEESGYDTTINITNSLSLKKGVVALSRAEDGQQSDASSFIVFLSDMSYLDGQYAAFAKVTSGVDELEDVADRAVTKADESGKNKKKSGKNKNVKKSEQIKTSKDGKIIYKEDRPVITSLRMVD